MYPEVWKLSSICLPTGLAGHMLDAHPRGNMAFVLRRQTEDSSYKGMFIRFSGGVETYGAVPT
jgi:hypothetical protein